MRELVTSEVVGPVCLIEMNDGRDNLLARSMCLQLSKTLSAAYENDSVELVLLTGYGDTFCLGVALDEISSEPTQTALFDLVDLLATAPKPVIGGVNGDALGAGFEIALLCSFRLVSPTAEFGFPDTALGLPPGAGATQTLPRIFGAGPALTLLMEGKTVGPGALRAAVDAEIKGDFRSGALRFVDAMAGQDLSGFAIAEREDGMGDPMSFQSGVFEARSALRDQNSVYGDIIKSVECALLLPFEAGLAFEREVFIAAEMRDASRGMRHLAAQRRSLPQYQSADAAGTRLLEHLDLTDVDVANTDGIVISALFLSLLEAAESLCVNGASFGAVDQALHDFGLEKGPFQIADIVGLDVLAKQIAALPDSFELSLPLFHDLAESGDIGIESEAGFYLYDDGHTGRLNPEAELLLNDHRADALVKVSDEVIVEVCLAAMANCGAKLLAEGVISKPGELDLLAVDHLGFAPSTGGPLHSADTRGLLGLRYHLSAARGRSEPHDYFVDMIKNGLNFSALNSEVDGAS